MNLYRKGYRAELNLVKILKRDRRFHTVIRSAGSRSPFDVIAISPARILLCQVKNGRCSLKNERRMLRRLNVPEYVHKQVRIYHRGKWTIVPVR